MTSIIVTLVIHILPTFDTFCFKSMIKVVTFLFRYAGALFSYSCVT